MTAPAATETKNITIRALFIWSASSIPGSKHSVSPSVRWKIVADHVPVFHNKPNALEFGDIGDRISRNGDEIRKFTRLAWTDAVRPAQHLGRVRSNRTNHIEGRQSGLAQMNKRCDARFSARLSRIKP